MSLATQFAGAIERAQFANELGELATDVWKAWGEGAVDDAQAQELAQAIEAKRPRTNYKAERTTFQKLEAPKAQRSPDKQASIERRRRLAKAAPVPSEHVHEFTTCELAVITVVAGEFQRCGFCVWCLAKIAAIAGTCKTKVRDALKKARKCGLLFSRERRRAGHKSQTNIVRPWCQKWWALLKWIGSKKARSTTNKDRKNGTSHPVDGSADNIFDLGESGPAFKTG
jgi:hypothetical protein